VLSPVRVNYSLGHGDKKLTNQLVHFGYMAALTSGILAAIVGTILGVIPPVLSALTIPGAANDQLLYPGCDIILDSTEGILPYWMIEMWAMPGTQLGLVLSGFMLGARELPTVGWLGGLSLGLQLAVWFGASTNAVNKLLVYGGSDFVAAWCMPLVSTLYIIGPLGADLREHTGFRFELAKFFNGFKLPGADSKHDGEIEVKETSRLAKEPEATTYQGVDQGTAQENTVEDGKDSDAEAEVQPKETIKTRQLLGEGLKIMFMDVAIQACISLAIYLALAADSAEGYELAALQSALPAYGMAYAIGMGITIKIAGPQLIAAGKYDLFARLARLFVLCAFILVPIIVGSVVPFLSQLAFNYGENACEYAKDDACLPFFTRIFGPNATGGDYSLSFTFAAFPVGASIDAVFLVLRACLLALVDLDYMMWCTIAAIVVYVPVVAVAATVPPFGGKAISFFVAMYTPQFVLVVLFIVRLEVLIRRIKGGREGTWTMEKHPSVRSSIVLQSK